MYNIICTVGTYVLFSVQYIRIHFMYALTAASQHSRLWLSLYSLRAAKGIIITLLCIHN